MGALGWPRVATGWWLAIRPNGMCPEATHGPAVRCQSTWYVPWDHAKPQKVWPEKVPAFLRNFPYGAGPDCFIPHQDGNRAV